MRYSVFNLKVPGVALHVLLNLLRIYLIEQRGRAGPPLELDKALKRHLI